MYSCFKLINSNVKLHIHPTKVAYVLEREDGTYEITADNGQKFNVETDYQTLRELGLKIPPKTEMPIQPTTILNETTLTLDKLPVDSSCGVTPEQKTHFRSAKSYQRKVKK